MDSRPTVGLVTTKGIPGKPMGRFTHVHVKTVTSNGWKVVMCLSLGRKERELMIRLHP